MTQDKRERIHSYLMENILPVGIAVLDRGKEGGPRKVLEVFSSTNEPFHLLREEGEEAAILFRERLDNVVPGLGNPIVAVNVSDESAFEDRETLIRCLSKIETGLEELDKHLNQDLQDSSMNSLNEE